MTCAWLSRWIGHDGYLELLGCFVLGIYDTSPPPLSAHDMFKKDLINLSPACMLACLLTLWRNSNHMYIFFGDFVS